MSNKTEEVEIIDRQEVYLIENGEREKRICGAIKTNGERCKAPAGIGTDHSGIGYCITHDLRSNKTKNWLETANKLAEGSKLGTALDRASKGEIAVNKIDNELLMQRGLLLWYIDHVMERDDNPEFTKSDIDTIRKLNRDLIKTKESAARIKGSLKLDAVVVRKFIDQLMSFLVDELESKLKRNEVMVIMEKMMEDVFIPLASRGMINGDLAALTQVPEGMKSMAMVDQNEEAKYIETADELESEPEDEK